MREKLGSFFFAMAFAVPFGGVGAFATWGIVKMVVDSHRAGDWVLVQAKVDDAALKASRGSKGGTTYAASGAYRYTIGGKQYVSTRLGFDALGGSDNVGDWHQTMAAFMESAKSSGRTIPVYVNPDNPEDAVVDRDVRWAMVAFMSIFALAFGGVGLGALVAAGFILFGKESKKERAKRESIAAHVAKHNRGSVGGGASSLLDETEVEANEARIDGTGGGAVLGVWIFAFIWNALSWPVAFLAWPTIVAGDWLVAFVFLFPFFGVLILWGAMSSTVALFRRGRAALRLETLQPRMGSRLAGAITFPARGKVGEAFDLEWIAYDNRDPNAADTNRKKLWSTARPVRLVSSPQGGSHLPFEFDIPARVRGSEAGLAWRLAVKAPGAPMAFDTFTIVVGPPREGASAFPEPGPHPDLARNERAIAQIFGAPAAAKMSPQQREALASLSPDAQATAAKVVANWHTIRKVLTAFVVLVVGGVLVSVAIGIYDALRN